MTYLGLGIALGLTSGFLQWARARREKRAREIEREKRKAARAAKGK